MSYWTDKYTSTTQAEADKKALGDDAFAIGEAIEALTQSIDALRRTLLK